MRETAVLRRRHRYRQREERFNCRLPIQRGLFYCYSKYSVVSTMTSITCGVIPLTASRTFDTNVTPNLELCQTGKANSIQDTDLRG